MTLTSSSSAVTRLSKISVYRELRKLSNQLTNQRKIANTFKRGAPMRTIRQWMRFAPPPTWVASRLTFCARGVLIPREDYVVRLAYQPAEEMNAYCEIPDKVFGVWSPRLGEESRICTRLVKWTIRAKSKAATEAKSGPGLGYDLLPSPTGDAWSSVNNATEDEKITDFSPRGEVRTENSDDEIFDFDSMTEAQRRKLWKRLREMPPPRRTVATPYPPGSDLDIAWRDAAEKLESRSLAKDARRAALATAIAHLESEAALHGLELGEVLALSLLKGGCLTVGATIYRAKISGELITRQQFNDSRKVGKLWERLRDNHGVNITKLRFDPVGEYQKMLKQARE
ncbi:replication protein [Enterobacter mori]|uniref:replication protein n=1 Tax=Enterobacter mori TaxID=539813 RepID=UPI002931CE4E|nr:replication protein [Enterobacter mori]